MPSVHDLIVANRKASQALETKTLQVQSLQAMLTVLVRKCKDETVKITEDELTRAFGTGVQIVTDRESREVTLSVTRIETPS